MYMCLLCLKLAIGSEDRKQRRLFQELYVTGDLETYLMSQISNYPLYRSHIIICASLVEIHPMVHKLECRQKAILTQTLKTTIEL